MLNLLTAEKLKLFRSRKFWITLGLFIFLPIYHAVNTKISVHYGKELFQPVDTVVNGASGVLMTEKSGLAILLIISTFISFYIGEEFQHGTIRNALSLGRSRTHYYLSKLATASLLTFVSMIILTVLGMISFTIAFGFGDIDGITNYARYALQTFCTLTILILANVSTYVMISFLTKSSSISLIWSFLYTIGTGFGPGIFQQTENFKHVTFWFTESFLFYLDFAKDMARYPEMVFVSLITIVISSMIGIFQFKRMDIK